MEEIKQRVIKALREVYDPEIPINVYDLGLVYDIKIDETNNNELVIKILMGVTSPFCPVTSTIAYAVEYMVKSAVPEAKDVVVEVTLDPPWSPTMITPEGREQLKAIYGYDVVEDMIKRASQQS
ncbi:MAG: metal-sulfur cluster assembly factor [Fervidicoccaceae archaeon]|jgi:metal-sulfur cluster biosynthetic enzyme|nr:metal-sulfur cluster assembly factor [Fervidicoccaceae archaeon]